MVGGSARVRLALRCAAYALHACARPGAGAIDLAGTSFVRDRGDDFVVPAMVLLSPACAMDALDRRWEQLPGAARDAQAKGVPRGACLPYGTTPPWAVCGCASGTSGTSGASGTSGDRLRTHGGTMAAINAWNYYRATQDLDWLAERGYPLIRSVADLVANLAVLATSASAASGAAAAGALALSGPSTYVLDAARVAGGLLLPTPPRAAAATAGNALEVASVVATLRCAMEASYELGFAPRELWGAVRYGLGPLVQPPPATSVLAPDTPVLPEDPPEPLLCLVEPVASLSSDLWTFLPSSAALAPNVAYWQTLESVASASASASVSASAASVISAPLVLAAAEAQAAQTASGTLAVLMAAGDAVLARLDAFLDRHMHPWGDLRHASAVSAASGADLGLSAQLLLVFLQGLGGVQVQGGVTETRFYYASLGVNANASAVLPSTWQQLVIHGLGAQQDDLILFNRASASGGGSWNPGNLGPPPVLVPWSVSALS